MATIIDYIASEHATFDRKPLCEVDSLVFSQLAMVRMAGFAPMHHVRDGLGARMRRILGRIAGRHPEGARFADLLQAEHREGMFVGLAPDNVRDLLVRAAASPRFGDIVIHDYVSEFSEALQTQFAAMSFSFPRRFTYIAFRGTDKSWVGWKEDFDMAYAAPVPAQESAARYALEMCRKTRGPLYLGGHSKGGNLAVFAAAKLPEKAARRIVAVYDHDGPGFSEGVLTERELARVRHVTRKTVPQESLVGMLMESEPGYRVVKSAGHGIEQHSLFRWQVEDGRLAEAGKLAPSARFTADVLNEWIAEIGPLERRHAVDALFEALRASGAKDAFEVLTAGSKALGLLVEAARRTSPEARDVIVAQMKRLSGIAARKAGAAAAEVLISRGRNAVNAVGGTAKARCSRK